MEARCPVCGGVMVLDHDPFWGNQYVCLRCEEKEKKERKEEGEKKNQGN